MINDSTGSAVFGAADGSKIRVSGSLDSHYAPVATVVLDQSPSAGQGFIAMANIQTPEGVIRLASPGSDDEFAVYSEFIDKSEEHRFMIFNGELIAWMERKPINQKAKTGEGDKDSEMEFAYEYKTDEILPADFKEVIKKFVELFPDLQYLTLDVMRGVDKKIYVIEINSKAGMPFDISAKLYQSIFKDFYGKKVGLETDKNLNTLSTKLITKTLEKEKGKFTIQNGTT
jgi:hypothetical protein